jgi:N-formylglutamate deformylase
MTSDAPAWLHVVRGSTPLIVSVPHAGTRLESIESRLVSPWLGRKDADWHIDKLYDFARGLGATIVRTSISRTVIDVNRDPSGASLYPGQATTELCPTTTFDGEALYRSGERPNAGETDARRRAYFDPYHAALAAEIARLRAGFPRVVLYDCHSIRSNIPRLFAGELPIFNLGTNSGASADRRLVALVELRLASSGQSFVVNGRFKGGWITRAFGAPSRGVHALQMELACRAYMREPEDAVDERNWPSPYEPDYAAGTQKSLTNFLDDALAWARS